MVGISKPSDFTRNCILNITYGCYFNCVIFVDTSYTWMKAYAGAVGAIPQVNRVLKSRDFSIFPAKSEME